MNNATKTVAPIINYFGFTLDQVRERSRKGSLPACRQFCMAALRQRTGMKLTEIGEFVGVKDHSTVIYGIEQVERMIMFGPKKVRESLNDLYKKHVA